MHIQQGFVGIFGKPRRHTDSTRIAHAVSVVQPHRQPHHIIFRIHIHAGSEVAYLGSGGVILWQVAQNVQRHIQPVVCIVH